MTALPAGPGTPKTCPHGKGFNCRLCWPKRASAPYRVFEAFDEQAGDPVRWIAAPTEDEFKAAAERKGWRAGAEIRPCPIPQDRKGLKQMGVDLIVGGKS